MFYSKNKINKNTGTTIKSINKVADRVKANKEKAAKDKAAKDKAEKEQAAKDKAEKDKAEKDKKIKLLKNIKIVIIIKKNQKLFL